MTDATRGSPRRALVLSGGGARGAYEAGVLRFILDELPRDLGRPATFDILTGTSVGAIHACFVAATAHLEHGRGTRLHDVWDGLEAGALFGSPGHALLRLPRRLLGRLGGRTARPVSPAPQRLHGLLDTTRLEAMVTRAVPWAQIRPNLDSGRIQALSVAATDIASGRTVAFVETGNGGAPPWTRDTRVVAEAAHIGPAHAFASAAIPFLFPAVRIGDRYYADGGLRLNTPLAPALRLGADRILVVSLRQAAPEDGRTGPQRVEHYGNPLFLLGKVLNALLLDPIEADLEHLRVLNDMLRRVGDLGGPRVMRGLDLAVAADRGQPFKIIDDLVLRPSRDLGLIAGEVAHGSKAGRSASAVVRILLRALGFGKAPFEADLLSYLFFDQIYTRPLMALGFADAERARASLRAFFAD